MQKSLDAAAAQAITEWIKSVENTLNTDQRQKLVALSVELAEKMEGAAK